MPFQRPSLTDLVSRIQQDFVSRLELSGPVLRRAVIYVLGRALAGAAHMLHGRLDYLSRQLFVDQAESDYLRRWGGIYGMTPNAATFANGSVSFTGTNGTVIPKGTNILRSDQAVYSTGADTTIASGSATATVTAAVAGAAGNCDAGTAFTLESPIAGVNSSVTASAGLSGGADQETDDEFRVRVLARIQNAPHGGDPDDYVAWAKTVTGVTRAWCYPAELGAGTVVVRFMRDDDVDGSGNPAPIPDSTEVAAVQSAINPLRPATANVTVLAPVADPLNLTIHISPDTTANRTAVTTQLTDLLALGEPGAVLRLSKIRTAIGDAGLDDYTLTTPSADVTPATGHIPTLGTITWT